MAAAAASGVRVQACQGIRDGLGGIVLSIRIDNGVLLASRVRVVTKRWERHRPFDRPELSRDQALLLSPAGSIHSFGMLGSMDVVFLDRHWRVLACRACVRPRRWVSAPRATTAALLLAAGRCALTGLESGMTLCRDHQAKTALPFATTVLRRSPSTPEAER